jgi:hypothetical protein
MANNYLPIIINNLHERREASGTTANNIYTPCERGRAKMAKAGLRTVANGYDRRVHMLLVLTLLMQ